MIGGLTAIHFLGPECGPNVETEGAVGRHSQVDVAIIERGVVDHFGSGPGVPVVGRTQHGGVAIGAEVFVGAAKRDE